MKEKLIKGGIITGFLVLSWYGMLHVPLNAARAWALVATLLLFPAAWCGWHFGHTEERGRLAGIDQAFDKTFGALSKAAGLRTDTARSMRRIVQDSYVVLPDVEIVQRQLPRGQEIIEL